MKTRNRIWLGPIIVIGLVLILTYSCKKDEEPADKITDKDGNVYTSVAIGTQVWMVENLKTTKFNDGNQIINGTDNTSWASLTNPLYCWYNNDISSKTPYGALYNYSAVGSGKLCPDGWHVPSYTDLNTLISFLGGEGVAGGKLKESGTAHWQSPNLGATNEYGFTALPVGKRESVIYGSGGGFGSIGQIGWHWAIDKSDPGTVLRYLFNTWATDLTLSPSPVVEAKNMGCAVRCIKD